eukprot:6339735-Prorocentrum_lima.AAC.1
MRRGPPGWHVAHVRLPAANRFEAVKHLLLPDECRLGYLYHLVASNLGLSPRSFRLSGTSFSDV